MGPRGVESSFSSPAMIPGLQRATLGVAGCDAGTLGIAQETMENGEWGMEKPMKPSHGPSRLATPTLTHNQTMELNSCLGNEGRRWEKQRGRQIAPWRTPAFLSRPSCREAREAGEAGLSWSQTRDRNREHRQLIGAWAVLLEQAAKTRCRNTSLRRPWGPRDLDSSYLAWKARKAAPTRKLANKRLVVSANLLSNVGSAPMARDDPRSGVDYLEQLHLQSYTPSP